MRDTPIGQWPSSFRELLGRGQEYLVRCRGNIEPTPDMEAGWRQFYDSCTDKIQRFAIACHLPKDDLPDCVQDVWTELLARLPTFRLDPSRGKFDTWLFQIVRSKVVDLCRGHKHRLVQDNADTLQNAIDQHACPTWSLEQEEMLALALDQLRNRLPECTFQVLQMRLAGSRSVAEVATQLGLSHEQVWYRYHRARRELKAIGLALADPQAPPQPVSQSPPQKKAEDRQMAQGNTAFFVSPNASQGRQSGKGGGGVDFIFKKVELGRRALAPEWKVEWDCSESPTPRLFLRKLSIVAYAEICGPEDGINNYWPRVVNAAVTAGVAAGIATIIATPTAALPVFRNEFKKHLQGKVGNEIGEAIHVALSANQEANGPWRECKA